MTRAASNRLSASESADSVEGAVTAVRVLEVFSWWLTLRMRSARGDGEEGDNEDKAWKSLLVGVQRV